MKKLFKFAMIAAALAVSSRAAAQDAYLSDPKWGANEAERKENATQYSFLTDMYNTKSYDEALPYLRHVIAKAPTASENLYVYGATIYKTLANRATSLAERNAYVDTLMMMYDKRIEHFGATSQRGKPYMLWLKALDYRTYKPTDRAGLEKMFADAFAVTTAADANPDYLAAYFYEMTEDFKADNVTMEQYMDVYDKMGPMLAEINKPESIETFEGLFMSSGAANPETIERIYGSKIDADPGDMETVSKAFNLLRRAGSKNDFYLRVAELMYNDEPTSQIALELAGIYEDRQQYDVAVKYLTDAMATETDPDEKVNLIVRMSALELGQNNARQAAAYARQALDVNPNSGLASYMLATAYGAGINGCSGYDSQAASWLVYDMLATARRLMEASGDTSQIANIDRQMAMHRSRFPSQEDLFFRELKEGSSVNVSCGWISGRTTVR